MSAGDYDFAYTSQSVYGHVIEVLQKLSMSGDIVLDLGCGYGAVAEPITNLGFTYVGCDIDPMGRGALERRGFEAHNLDLMDLKGFPERVAGILAGRSVAAILALDIVEHLPATGAMLDVLRGVVDGLEGPPLVLSIPNVSHFDIGAKLLFGHLDITRTGLLDETHVRFFTDLGLTQIMNEHGFAEIQRHDYKLYISDQHFPADYPALVENAPLHDLLAGLRSRADDFGYVNQFVRAYAAVKRAPCAPPDECATSFLSVIVRTQGTRDEMLVEALTCLAAQEDDDFEVLLLVHTADTSIVADVSNLVEMFDDAFSDRVSVIQADGRGRSRPLNEGLAAASGRYVAFLDDDDHVLAHWVAVFRRGAERSPGQVIRAITVDHPIQRNQETDSLAPYVSCGNYTPRWAPRFSLVEHLYENQTPICSFAAPLETVRTYRIGFGEDLVVQEDWDFLLRVAMLVGVVDVSEVTSVYHRWQSDDSTLRTVDQEVWAWTREEILRRLDASPLLLPAGSATAIGNLSQARYGWQRDYDRRTAELEDARADSEALRKVLAEVQHSTSWRVTRPLRAAGAVVKRISGHHGA